MPYGEHACILREIRALGPQALMIDFLFVDERRGDPTLRDLREELEAYRAAKIPLFLARPMDQNLKVLESLQALAHPVSVPRYVIDESHNLYPFSASYCWRIGEELKCVPDLTAAADIYLQICNVTRSPGCGNHVLKIERTLETESLALVWGRND